jgi:hypothetical protein
LGLWYAARRDFLSRRHQDTEGGWQNHGQQNHFFRGAWRNFEKNSILGSLMGATPIESRSGFLYGLWLCVRKNRWSLTKSFFRLRVVIE